MSPASYPAQIVFTEVDNVTGPRTWTGRLFRQSACVDVGGNGGTTHPRAVTWCPKFDITEDPDSLRCTVTFNGGTTKSSLRYATYRDVTAAMKAGIRWAARRFRVPVLTAETIDDAAIDWLEASLGGEGPARIEIWQLAFVAYRSENPANRSAARARLAAIANERSRA